jgi:hypothetical protein
MATPTRRPEQVAVSPAVWAILQLASDTLDTLTQVFTKGSAPDLAAPQQSAAVNMLGKRLRSTCQEALQQLRPRFRQWLANPPGDAAADVELPEVRAVTERLQAWLSEPRPAPPLKVKRARVRH